MHQCPQTDNQSTLDHGFSVKNYLFDLLSHLRSNKDLKYEWRIPSWVYDKKEIILKSLPSDEILKKYTILHDCGKWKCITIDQHGKRHFQNHSEISYEVYKSFFGEDVVSDLIRHDMHIHRLKSSNIDDFCQIPNYITLLIVGLCEINSNAKMFGGINSESFKIKYKSINKNGKKIIEYHEKNRG